MESDRFEQLQRFSRGEIPYRRLMDLLGIETDEALFLEMCKAGLPMPQLPEEETAAMVRLLGKICGGITMDSELWSPRNKLEDVLEACQAGDLTRAHMAALELSMRLNHAEAAWKRLSAPVVVDSSPLPDLPPLPPPRRLDEIVTRNRDQVEIRLATEAEVAALGEFLGSPEGLRDGEVKDTLTGWYPVFLRVKEYHVIRLLGQREKRGDISLVSRVLMLDQAAGLAITSRSIYRLGERGEGEPPRPYVIHLCAILNEMGLGERLGVPEVFF